MRITIAHSKTKAEVIQAVDRSFDDVFKNVGPLPIKLLNEQKAWSGSTLAFSFTAKIGLMSSFIKGTVEVTDKDLTIDADLGLLDRLLGSNVARGAIESKVRGLLT
jgi:hypothetical protein